MTHSVTDDQLRAFVERAVAERGEIYDLRKAILGKVDRLHYVLDRMAARRKEDSVVMRRIKRQASMLIGTKSQTLRARIASVVRHGSVESALQWQEQWMRGMEVWPVPELQGEMLGAVYVAKATEFPGVFKVGFSRDVSERMKALSYLSRTPIQLVAEFPGTMFDEHLLQHDMRKFAMANEWFDLDGRYTQADKYLRFYRPNRMWSVLHAQFGDVNTARKFNMEA